MPNIEIVGFVRNQGIEGKVRNLIHRLAPKVVNDAIITTHHFGECEARCVLHGLQKPYVRVASTELKDRTRVAKLINEELGLDVEWLHLDGFFEGKV